MSDLRRQILDARSPLSVQFLPPAKEVWEGGGVGFPSCTGKREGVGFPSCTGKGEGVGFPACTGKGTGLDSHHALVTGDGVGFPACTRKGEGGWLPCMHWEGGLASQHAPELGKAGSMHPAGMLSCLYFG